MIDLALLFFANSILKGDKVVPPTIVTNDVPIDPGLDPSNRPQSMRKRPKQRDDGTFFGL